MEVDLVIGLEWVVQDQVHPAVLLTLESFAISISNVLSHTASVLLVDIFPDASSTAYASRQVARCGLSAASVAAP